MMLGCGSNKSLNIKCAKWFDRSFQKRKRKTLTRATNMNAKILHPYNETNETLTLLVSFHVYMCETSIS